MNAYRSALLLAGLGVFALTLPLAVAGPKLIHAGPMVGHVSDSTAQIWIRLKRGAELTGSATQNGKVHEITHWSDRGADCHVIGFTGLQAGTPTAVSLTAQRDGSDPETVELNFKTYPAPSTTGQVRLAFGSCSKISQYPKGPIYSAIAKEAPEFMVFLGDNAYFIVADGSDKHFSTTGPVGDWNFPGAMSARHMLTRVHPDLQTMFRKVPSYGIWDDHDYGPNNADREFEYKEEALRIFKQMWANPGWGTPTTPGIFSSFRCGPTEIFLMDDRYYKYSPDRHDDVTVETGALWGEAQLDWLLEGLKNSTAPVKVIANGTQVLSQDTRGEGHFQEAQGEQRRLFSFLAEHEIGGVVVISGDRHHSEALQHRQPDGTLLAEATSSPLQQDQAVAPFRRAHPTMLWGIYGNSYGLLTVDVKDGGQGTVTFEARDEQNTTPTVNGSPSRTVWTLSQLNYGGDKPKPERTWQSLFNGKDLTGWTPRNGSASYQVHEGSIVGKTAKGSPNSFLCTEIDYEDFELMFEVKVDDDLNSGVQIRSLSKADYKNGRVHGPQVEIAANAPNGAGYIYSEGTGRGWISQERQANEAFRKGEWNHYQVRAVGDRIQTWINGTPVADVSDSESPRSGFIGLQVHSIPQDKGPFEVRWRQLFVRPLEKE